MAWSAPESRRISSRSPRLRRLDRAAPANSCMRMRRGRSGQSHERNTGQQKPSVPTVTSYPISATAAKVEATSRGMKCRIQYTSQTQNLVAVKREPFFRQRRSTRTFLSIFPFKASPGTYLHSRDSGGDAQTPGDCHEVVLAEKRIRDCKRADAVVGESAGGMKITNPVGDDGCPSKRAPMMSPAKAPSEFQLYWQRRLASSAAEVAHRSGVENHPRHTSPQSQQIFLPA
jgi:hypothetical protein